MELDDVVANGRVVGRRRFNAALQLIAKANRTGLLPVS